MTNPAAKYYDLLSSDYDRITSEPGVWMAPGIISQTIAPLLQNKTKLLEIGIGTGQLLCLLRKTGKDFQAYGTDVSQKMCDICASKYSDVIIHHGDILEVELPYSDYFDVITICGTLEFVPDLNLLFRKVNAMLCQGGYLAFTYEPIITNHPIQAHQKSLTVPSSGESKLYIDDFFTYRYSPFQIYKELLSSGFEYQSDVEFVAYRKRESDIIYHLVVAQRRK